MFNSDTFSLSRVVLAGIVAGLAFAAFVTVGALVLGGPAHVFAPIRMVAAMALGPATLDPAYSAVVAGAVGLALHLLLSVAFAIVFASMIPVTFSTAAEVELGMAYGFVLWFTNLYLLGPALGWIWFAEQANPLLQLAAHTVAYGAVLGWFRHYEWLRDESRVDPKLHEWHALN